MKVKGRSSTGNVHLLIIGNDTMPLRSRSTSAAVTTSQREVICGVSSPSLIQSIQFSKSSPHVDATKPGFGREVPAGETLIEVGGLGYRGHGWGESATVADGFVFKEPRITFRSWLTGK